MKISNLSKVSLEELVDCFLLAFENYYVKMPTDKQYYENRWKAAGVNYELSYGMFNGGRLVGFIIHAVDERLGMKTAFNTGTGVIPEFRGQRIVQKIYEKALPDLKYNGVERSTLEVIQENVKAIRAYQGVGFEITREYSCFSGKFETNHDWEIQLVQIDKKDFDWSSVPNPSFYSWDFQRETVERGKNEFYQVLYDSKPESFFIFNPESKFVAQFDSFSKDKNSWNRLFQGIHQVSEEVRIINVDNRLKDKLDIIQKVGVPLTVKQYEMELDLQIRQLNQ